MSKHTAAEVSDLERKISEGYTLSSNSLINVSEMLRAYADLLAAMEKAKPVAWVKSSEWNDAKVKRQSFNGWRHNYGDCDMVLFTHPPAQAWIPVKERLPEASGWRWLHVTDGTNRQTIRYQVGDEVLKFWTHWRYDDSIVPPPEGAGHD